MEEILNNKFDSAFDNKEDLTMFANEFSEGDNQLKETLLNLWNNNIRTDSCCRGHETDIYSIPAYVGIVIDQNSKNLIFELYNKIYPKYKDVEFGIHNGSHDSFFIHMRDDTKKDTLNIINQSIGIRTEDKEQVIDNALYILEYANKLSLKLSIIITNDKIYLEFKSLTDETWNIEYSSIDESIELLSDLSNISHLFIMCNPNELDRVVDILSKKKVR